MFHDTKVPHRYVIGRPEPHRMWIDATSADQALDRYCPRNRSTRVLQPYVTRRHALQIHTIRAVECLNSLGDVSAWRMSVAYAIL